MLSGLIDNWRDKIINIFFSKIHYNNIKCCINYKLIPFLSSRFTFIGVKSQFSIVVKFNQCSIYQVAGIFYRGYIPHKKGGVKG